MKEKRISFGQGKGSLGHNNRLFMTSNVDPLRTPDNITFVCQPIAEAYDHLFKESTERYNTKQIRNDRKIHGSYYEYLFHCKPSNSILTSADKRKSFYEDVMQIGRMEDSGVGTEDFQLVAECLKEYMTGFQERNPNFYVFNAVLHMDEQTPHLHIDYIPVGHYQRGQDTQNGIAQALKEMGHGDGKNAIARWRAAEVEVMNAICRAHGIEPLTPEKSRGTLEVAEYKEQRHKADELAKENARVEAEIAEKKQERDQILHYLPDVEKTSRLEFKFDDLCDELDGLIKNPLSATKNRKRIAELGEEMKKRLMASYKARDRSETTVYEVREENEKLGKDWKETRERNRELSANNHKLYQEKSALQSQVDELTEFVSLLKRFEPQKYGEVKQFQEHIRTQREHEVQQQSTTKRKKLWGLE